jgi:preprotein translocase subunit SecF
MEMFANSRFDFLGRKWLFIGLSFVLTVAGLASLIARGGPRYGIEFKGGAVMVVRWSGSPPVERIRAALSERLPGVAVVAARDLSGHHEVLISTQAGDVRQTILDVLAKFDDKHTIRSFEAIGPQIGADLRRQALLATGAASAGMLAYLALRFQWIYGVAAVAAAVHDTVITVGLFSLLDKEISLTVVAALLTLIGYSMNDTIVVFDRIRENRRKAAGSLSEVINLSINQTLSRTVLTSGLTLLTALALLAFGGPVLHGFSFALVVGIIVGTYSSVFIASPMLLMWAEGGRR